VSDTDAVNGMNWIMFSLVSPLPYGLELNTD